MRISEKMGLNKSKLELDFFDYNIERDTYAFLDPYYIARKEDEFLKECNEYVETFFNRFLYYLQNREELAYELFAHLGEVNEICLGMSKGAPSGKGIGGIDTRKIFAAIKESEAFKTGIAQHLEDVRVFVPGVDKDKISDMVANIIKYPLIKYTQEQCKLWGVATISIEAGYWWNKDTWVRGHQEMLVIDDKPYLLFPKNLVSNAKRYSSEEYFKMYILEFLKQQHLANDTYLVHKSYNKNGTLKNARVFKKEVEADLKAQGEIINKDWLARFTKENPDVYSKFQQKTIDKIIGIDSEPIIQAETNEIIDTLIQELKLIPEGKESATKYHHLISGILELLFYPYIAHPKIEDGILGDRKRIDITFSNIAQEGFFDLLGTLYNVPCALIMVECKNYSKDISNPELDQMAGRFSARRGKFGIICCRSINDEALFVERERDTVKDDRGYIIHLTDDEIIELLERRKANISVGDYLVQKYNEIIK